MLTFQPQIRRFQQTVNRGTQAFNSFVQTLTFDHLVFRNKLRYLDPWFVEYNVTNRDPTSECQTVHLWRMPLGERTTMHFAWIDQFAGTEQFGQDHRHCLKNLNLFFRVVTLGPVLDNQNAQHPTAAYDGYAHQGMIDFLAGFGSIGKIGMRLRVGQIEGCGPRRNFANKALTHAQAGLVNGFQIQSDGRKQFKNVARPHSIDRAHFGNHIAGNK